MALRFLDDPLSANNVSAVIAIVSAGRLIGTSREMIEVAVNLSNAESALGGDLTVNVSGGTARGLFQYIEGTWGAQILRLGSGPVNFLD
jgi:hypothetical protein